MLDSRGNETEIEITESVTSKRLSTRPIGKSVSERVYLQQDLEKIVEDLKRNIKKALYKTDWEKCV